MLKPTSMAIHNVYLNQFGTDLYWANSQTGNFTKMECDTVTTKVKGGDEIVFTALDGIRQLIRIDDGLNGSIKLFQSTRNPSDKSIIVTILPSIGKDVFDRYSITYKTTASGAPITFDPEIKGEGNP